MTAPIARRRGSFGPAAIGSAGGSTTIVARVMPRASVSSELPSSGNRSASRTAAVTSATARPGRDGRKTTASSGAAAITSREPDSRGTRFTARFKQARPRYPGSMARPKPLRLPETIKLAAKPLIRLTTKPAARTKS